MHEVRLDQDYHVHTSFSDDAVDTPAANLAAAVDAGLTTLCLVDHVRADTTWVPVQVAVVRDLAARTPLTLLAGVEAKILDASGALDLPADADLVDHVLVADHQFPSESGPLAPSVVAEQIARGDRRAGDVVVQLVDAMVCALHRVERPVLAHPFSLLPKMGLDEAAVSDTLLHHLAAGARSAGALVEVNEKWDCPGPRLAEALARRGVRLVAGSDSHRCVDVGRYRRVADNLGGWHPGVVRAGELAGTP